jgi:hypothetical protein
MRKQAIGLAIVAALSVSLAAPPAHASSGVGGDRGTLVAAPDSSDTVGTNSALPQQVPSVCDPHHTWYKVTSSTKSAKITRWSKHIKNDRTRESFKWSTSRTAGFKAKVDTTGSISGEIAIKKIAKATLGGGVSYGLEGQAATTRTYSRTVTFDRPGKWIIFRGVYSGSGKVSRYKCSSNGQSYSRIGFATASTFEKASVTGLINCAKSVNDRVARSAKAKCG